MSRRKSIFRIIKKYIIITFASSLFGAGLTLFIDPNNLAPGGVSGLAIILNRLIPIETGTLFFLINIPIIILGIWKFGWKFIVSTVYSIFMVSLFSNLLEMMPPMTNQPILAALFGGTLTATGMGLVLRNGSTTGGTDIIVKCIRKKIPYLKMGTLFLIIDGIIIGIGGLVFGNIDAVLFSILSATVTSQVLDLVLYGKDEAKLIYIISNSSQTITSRILEELQTGVTHLSGSGAYRREEKQVILCVVKKQNAHRVEEIVRQEDSNAFMIISSATEIYGEGYKSYFGEYF